MVKAVASNFVSCRMECFQIVVRELLNAVMRRSFQTAAWEVRGPGTVSLHNRPALHPG